jgi:hypothetical protein
MKRSVEDQGCTAPLRRDLRFSRGSGSGPRNPKSLGLAGLRERAYLLKGKVAMVSEPGVDTSIRGNNPVAQASECDAALRAPAELEPPA